MGSSSTWLYLPVRMEPLDLLHYAYLGLLPVQLAISTWLGTRFGAFATMRILVPLPFYGFWAEWTIQRTSGRTTLMVDDVQHAMSTSLLSFLTLFSFSLPYFALLRVCPHRLPNRMAMLVSLLGATAAAVGLRVLYRPLMELIYALPRPIEHLTAAVVALASMFGAHVFFRRFVPADGRAPAPCPPWNALARVLTLIACIAVLDSRELRVSTLGFILTAIPRLTPELVAGTHAASGPASAEAVLAGLPLGLAPYVVFCGAYPFLMSALDVWTAYAIAVALSLCSIVPLVADLLTRRSSP